MTTIPKLRADDAQLMLSVFNQNKIIPEGKPLSQIQKELIIKTLASLYVAQNPHSKITEKVTAHHIDLFKANSVQATDAESIVQAAYKRAFNISDVPVEEGKVELPPSLEGRIDKIAQKALYACTYIPRAYLSFIAKVSGSITHLIFHHKEARDAHLQEANPAHDEPNGRVKSSCCQRLSQVVLKKFGDKLVHNLASLTVETVLDKAIQTVLIVAPYYIYQNVKSTYFE